MPGFADDLGTALAGTLQRMQAPPPPPPEGTFADGLAAFFGGGPNLSGAYDAGIEQRGKYTAQSAQTLNALAGADKNRQEAMRESQANALRAKIAANPNYMPTPSEMALIATGANDFANARLGFQEHGFRGTLADPNAAPEARHLAGQGVQGRVLPRIETAGGQNYNMATDPNMQAPTMTPMQQAQVDAENALKGQRDRSPVAAGTDGAPARPPTGYRWAANGNLEPIPGGPANPQMGSRERAFAERVRVAGESVADTLENISQMPIGASTGVFGIGSSPGKGILASTRDTLRNAATSEDVQIYTAALAGANRALAVLESAGLAPSGTAVQSMEALAWREGDTDQGTKLYKLAEMRQTVDNAMQTALTNPAITPDMAGQINEIRRRVAAAIPFSPLDIVKLRQAQGATTLADVLRMQGLRTETPAAPAANAPPGGAAVMRSTSKLGKPIISKDGGKTWEYE
jgi:hypothetical protein